jgi:sterol desaturase/sphingolipid hydroxylase (fatty acid hydroxylase superfamily)
MDLCDRLGGIVRQLGNIFFAFGTYFSLPSLLVAFCVAIGFLAWRQHRRRRRVSFAVIRRAVFRRRFLSDRSLRADIGFFFLNTLTLSALIGWGIFSGESVARALENGLTSVFGTRLPVEWPEPPLRAVVTLALFVAYEFGYWLDHFLKHRIPFLWETHKPHHSAETLTPFTVWRVHPLDTLIFANILALTVGAASGFIAYGLGREVSVFSVDGANFILVVFIYAYVHLQHSQFWIPFTGALGRVFMSPAQHQIHHSSDPRHHDRNFGSCLSVFDWLFGTLELPSAESPGLKFGVDQQRSAPHSVTTLLITPVLASLGLVAAGSAGAIGAGLAWVNGGRRVQLR